MFTREDLSYLDAELTLGDRPIYQGTVAEYLQLTPVQWIQYQEQGVFLVPHDTPMAQIGEVRDFCVLEMLPSSST